MMSLVSGVFCFCYSKFLYPSCCQVKKNKKNKKKSNPSIDKKEHQQSFEMILLFEICSGKLSNRLTVQTYSIQVIMSH